MKKIKILKDGPYQVSGNVPLDKSCIELDEKGEKWTDGGKVDSPQETYHLCRCGRSKNKPFCDGSHESREWHRGEYAHPDGFESRADEYEGPAVKLIDCVELCAVAKFCDFHQGVWKLAQIAEEGSPEEDLAIYMAHACPSGRLIIEKNGEKIEPELMQKISLIEDKTEDMKGPLWVQGGIELEGQNGTKYQVRNRMTLCRCGESNNMPFCDASHRNCSHMKGLDQ